MRQSIERSQATNPKDSSGSPHIIDIRHRITLLISLSFLFPHAALTQTGTVMGAVSLSDTSDWGGISVVILGRNKSVTTQANGQFSISAVPAGPVSVQAGKLFYANARIDTSIAAGQTLTLNFSLTRSLADTMLVQQSPNFRTAITNSGNIGALNRMVDEDDPGFTWSGQQHLLEASLMIGVDTTRVSDAARFILGIAQENLDRDFLSLSDIVVLTHGQDSTVFLTAFDDSRSNFPPGIPSQPLGIRVTQKTYSFGDAANSGFLIVQLTLTNVSTVTLQNLLVGWFVDWDVLPTPIANRGGVLFVQNSIPGVGGGQPFQAEVAYQRSGAVGTAFMGLVPMSQSQFRASRIASVAQEIRYDAPNRGLTEANKYRYMLDRRLQNPHGDFGVEEDLAMIVSLGGASTFMLAPNDSVVVGCAFVGGSDSAEFVNNALQAQRKWVEVGNNLLVTAVSPDREIGPVHFALEQNFPNPFNPATTISYVVPEEAHVVLSVCDILGRNVVTLVDRVHHVGAYSANWDGKDALGRPAASGLYFYRLEAVGVSSGRIFAETRKMMLLR